MKLLTSFALALLTTACAGTTPATNQPKEATMSTDKTLRGHGDASTIANIVTLKIKPEFEQAFVDFAADIVRRVYEQEPGVLTYTMYKHPTEPSTYVLIERYRDQAAFDAHLASPMMAEVGQKLPGWVAGPGDEVQYKQLLPR